jgi:hypothetical protein
VDILHLLLIWLTFATWISIHVSLSVTIGSAIGSAQGWLSMLCPPMAPVFGFQAGARGKSLVWLLVGASYLSLLFFASR